MRISQMKPAAILLLMMSAFAISMAAFAFSSVDTRRQEMLFEPQATATRVTPTIARNDGSNSQPRSIAETINELRATNRAIDDAMDTRIPPTTRRLLTMLKHQLRLLIVEILKSPTAQHESTQELKQQMVVRLAQQGVTLSAPPFPEFWSAEAESIIGYGYIDSIMLEHPITHPELLAVTTELAINCGEDTSFYLFKQSLDGYRLILALEANGYETVSGAQNSFAYSLSPPDEAGNFFVVAANVNAWCTSRWQMLRYKVLRVSASPDEPQVIVSAEHGVLTDKEPIFKLTTTVDGFKYTFWHEQSLDAGIQERQYVLNYILQNNAAKRIAPLAFKPEDFLDEWIHLSWDEAAQWVAPSKLDEIQTWHEQLQESDSRTCSELDAVRLCQAKPKTWQVAADCSRKSASESSSQIYFKISRKQGAFFIEDITTNPDEVCSGKNLLDQQ